MQRQLANLVHERTRCVQWMQKAMDQMNVQVHRAVSDLAGTTGLAIVRAIVAGERDPLRLAAHRDPRCRKSVQEIAQYLTGNWRQEHLFNLASALRLFDIVDDMIASYDARLLKEIEALQPPDRQYEPVPTHPNPTKEKAIRGHGEQQRKLLPLHARRVLRPETRARPGQHRARRLPRSAGNPGARPTGSTASLGAL